MKKILSLVLIFMIFLNFGISYAVDVISENGPRVFIGNNELDFITNKPILMNDRTLLPMRSLFEALGYLVSWQPQDKRIIAFKDGNIVIMQIGNKTLYVNDKVFASPDVSPIIYKDRTYIPVRILSESIGAKVEYDSKNRIVKIVYKW